MENPFRLSPRALMKKKESAVNTSSCSKSHLWNWTNRAVPMPMTDLRRSPFSVRRSRAFSSSTLVISALLFHVPDDEDEPELAHRDHERDDHVQEEDDESGPRLADQGHDRHDHYEEQRERHDDGHKGFREHPERLHLLPHLEAVFLLELLRLHEEVRFELAAARGRRHDALQEVRELGGRGALAAFRIAVKMSRPSS